MNRETLLIVDAETDEVIGHLDARQADMAVVDALARVQLRARRRGARIRLANVSPQLRGLLELVGLADALGVQPQRKPELGEEVGVDEVMEPGDPPV
jgi:ABC-type transporter Mla MlaB component